MLRSTPQVVNVGELTTARSPIALKKNRKRSNSKAAGRPEADGFALSPQNGALQVLENAPPGLAEPAAKSGWFLTIASLRGRSGPTK
jgi:hypothetical protein